MIGWRSLLLLLLMTSVPLQAAIADVAPRPASGSNVPQAPEPWWVSWSHDRDGDRIDDAIDPYTDATLDVFVRYARAPTEADVARAMRITATAATLFPLAEAVYVTDVPYAALADLLELPGAVVIEKEKVVLPMLDVASSASLITFSPELGNGARGRWRVTGRDSVIAVLDTGVDQEHEAFGDLRFVGGYDATVPTGSLADRLLTVGATQEHTRNVTGDTPLSTVDPDDQDVHSHGTHVAGIALGADPNGTYVGIAPMAKLLDVKVVGDFVDDRSDVPFGLGSTVIEGLEFVHRYNQGRTHLGEPGNDTVDIVTLSVGEESPDPEGDSVLAHAVNRLVDTGVIVVAAAGNCGPTGTCPVIGNNTIVAPGSARQAITVGAIDDGNSVPFDDDRIAPYSSVGPNGGEPKPNLVAYGTGIIAPEGAPASGVRAVDGYRNNTGTSMATPIVAGVVALMREADPTLDAARAKEILMQTARDLQDTGWDAVSGAGALNAYYAVGVALGFMDLAAVIDDTGHEHVEEKEVIEEVTRPVITNQAPKVAFDAGPLRPTTGEFVVFIDRSTDPERDKLVAWNWDFGDGQTAKGDRTAHAYERPGTYTVRLSVTDVNGTAGMARKEIEVQAPPGKSKDSPAGPALVVPLVALAALAALRRSGRRDAQNPPTTPSSPAPRAPGDMAR